MLPSECDVVLVDDHPLLGEGLRAQLERRGVSLDIAPVAEVDAILSFIEHRAPRLVVLDYSIPTIGVSTPLIEPIRESGAPVLILTGTVDDALWGSLLEKGAVGVMGKEEPLSQLLDGIETALAGEPFRPGRAAEYRIAWLRRRLEEQERLAPFLTLSTREAEVASALVEGDSPADIARKGFVSIGTVRSQLKSIYRKLGVSSQLELATLARNAGWSGNPQPDSIS